VSAGRSRRAGHTTALGTAGILITLLAACASGAPPAVSGGERADRSGQPPAVVILGVPGLTWADINSGEMPALARLADGSAIGSVSDRGPGAGTACLADSWATLGAGNRALGAPSATSAHCAAAVNAASLELSADGSGDYPGQRAAVDRNDAARTAARPGALADALGCITVVGAAAAPAGSHSTGRIDHFWSVLAADPARTFQGCPSSVVAAPDVSTSRSVVDDLVSQVDAARSAGSVLVVTGLGDPSRQPHLHAIVVNGPGFDRGWVTSATTGRVRYVQLADVAATAIAIRNAQAPTSVSGRTVTGVPRAHHDSDRAALVDADRRARAQVATATAYFSSLVGLQLLLFAAAAYVLRRRWRRADRDRAVMPDIDRADRLLELGCIASACVLPATLVAQVVPWWRAWSPGIALGALVMVIAAGLTAVTYLGPWRHAGLGRVATTAAICGAVPLLDVLLGSHLQLDSVAGYSTIVAGRFAGLGNVGFAEVVAGLLVLLGCAVTALPVRLRAVTVLAAGAAVVIVVASPWWGDFVGGTVALVPAVAVMASRVSPRRLSSVGTLAVVLLFGLLVVGFAGFDYARPRYQRTGLGRFVAALHEGGLGGSVRAEALRKAGLLATSPLTFVIVGGALLVSLVLLRPSGGLRRVFGIHAPLRAASLGVLVAAGLGFGLSESGVTVPAVAALVGLPLAIVACLNLGLVLRRDRVRRPGLAAEATK
jgi:hypothetical protein